MTWRAPWIGVTAGAPAPGSPAAGARPGYCLDAGYAHAVLAAGGLPVVLPPAVPAAADAALARLDGLLLSGGPDVDPGWFGEDPRPGQGRIDPERDAWEIALVRAALALDLPLLAICRGVQVLNVAAGGTLLQDIPTQVPGAWKHLQEAPRAYPTHPVRVEAGTRLGALLASARGTAPAPAAPLEARVNSFHHQAVGVVAPGLAVAARAGDGVVEALESPDHTFALGVQWHPEAMWEGDGAALALFRGLVDAAGARAAAREG